MIGEIPVRRRKWVITICSIWYIMYDYSDTEPTDRRCMCRKEERERKRECVFACMFKAYRVRLYTSQTNDRLPLFLSLICFRCWYWSIFSVALTVCCAFHSIWYSTYIWMHSSNACVVKCADHNIETMSRFKFSRKKNNVQRKINWWNGNEHLESTNKHNFYSVCWFFLFQSSVLFVVFL